MTSTDFVSGFEFDRMSRRPLYEASIGHLIGHCQIRPDSTVVDLGCGSGAVTQRILDRFPALNMRICAIEPSEAELKIARSRISDRRVTFLHARAQEALQSVQNGDVVLLSNVIHQIPLPERHAVCEAAFQLLKPGGRFVVSTLFYEGAVHPGTQRFYFQWMRAAHSHLQSKGAQLQLPKEKPPSLQLCSVQEYGAMLSQAGFRDVLVDEQVVQWRVEDWKALSTYSVFIRGALGPNVDLRLGSEALVMGVSRVFQELGWSEMSRGWVYIAGNKPSA